jgi:hypothetical protein
MNNAGLAVEVGACESAASVGLVDLSLSPFVLTGNGRTHVGQQPTAVSPVNIKNCTFHPEGPPAVAVQADVYPFGHWSPGE